jgi:predicted transcriptional regulator
MFSKRVLEQLVRGFSNHRRIQMIDLLDKSPELSVDEISQKLHINFKTTSAHLKRLIIAGLIQKKSSGKAIRHKLTKRGNFVLTFLRTLE